MKKSNLFILVFILLKCSILFAQKDKKEKAAKDYKNIVVSITQKHLPEMYQKVIDENYCGPDCYKSYVGGVYVPWNMEVNEQIVYGKIGTIIHESVHGFNNGPWRSTVYKNGKASFIKYKGRLLISENHEINYEGRELIKSYKIVDEMLSDNPKTEELFRFDTYIDVGENGNISSNLSGLYGILDEFSAYYHGSNISFTIYNDLKENHTSFDNNLNQNQDDSWKENQYSGSFQGGNLKLSQIDNNLTNDSLRVIEERKIIDELASDCMSSYSSYYEFSVFIGGYLKYVKKHHPKMYYDILNNDNLRKAYKTIDKYFYQLVIKMEEEFGDGYQPEGRFWKITTGVRSRDLGKEIIIDYKNILNEFKNFDGTVEVSNETPQLQSVVLINNIKDFEFTDRVIEVSKHPLMLGSYPIKIITSKGELNITKQEFNKYILPLYTPTENGIEWVHR